MNMYLWSHSEEYLALSVVGRVPRMEVTCRRYIQGCSENQHLGRKGKERAWMEREVKLPLRPKSMHGYPCIELWSQTGFSGLPRVGQRWRVRLGISGCGMSLVEVAF